MEGVQRSPLQKHDIVIAIMATPIEVSLVLQFGKA